MCFLCTMDYPKFIVSNQKEYSISFQRVNKDLYFILNIAPPFQKIHFEVKFSLADTLMLEGTTALDLYASLYALVRL